MRGTDDRRRCECLPPIFFLSTFLPFLTHRLEKGERDGWWSDWSVPHSGRPSAGWRSTIRDARFKNARRTLCQCCLRVVPQQWHGMTNRHEGISGRWQAFIYDASPGRRAAMPQRVRALRAKCRVQSASRAPNRRSLRNPPGVGAERRRRNTGYRCVCAPLALVPVCDVYVRDPVYISNATIFGNSLRDERATTGSTHPYRWIVPRMQRIRGWTDHCEPPPPVIKLSSLNS